MCSMAVSDKTYKSLQTVAHRMKSKAANRDATDVNNSYIMSQSCALFAHRAVKNIVLDWEKNIGSEHNPCCETI